MLAAQLSPCARRKSQHPAMLSVLQRVWAYICWWQSNAAVLTMTQTWLQWTKYHGWCALVQHECAMSFCCSENLLLHPTQLEQIKVGDKQSPAYTSSAAKLNWNWSTTHNLVLRASQLFVRMYVHRADDTQCGNFCCNTAKPIVYVYH